VSFRELMGGGLEYYPGSKERRQPRAAAEPEAPLELGRPWVLEVRGIDVEFFPIGSLALALGRQPVTIRAWERDRVLPPSGWSKPGKDRDARGRRRIWTRPQIEGIVAIAREEGVLDPGPRISITKTKFTARVTALFEDLRKEGFR
jgi:hypothetical protein